MQAYIDKILRYTHQLSAIGFETSDDWSTAILLAGLTEEYKPFIMGIEATDTKLTTDNVISEQLDSKEGPSGEAFMSK